MKNHFRIFGIIALAAVIGFSVTACPGGDDTANPAVPGEPDNPGNPSDPGETPSLEGSWYSAQYSETFTFNLAEGTFTKMSDQGWGERGTFTYTANSITCTITEAYDGGTWKEPNPGAQLVWVRPYAFGDGVLVLYGTNVYVKKEPEPEPVGAAPYRILSIGASFTRDAMTYLRDMLVENGVDNEDILVVNAYIGGQTLAGHASNAKSNSPSYTRQSFGTRGAVTNTDSVRLLDLITSSGWDYINIQQGADQAGNPSAYNEADIEYLLEYVKTNCPNPDVKIMFHMTWAYDPHTTQTSVWNSFHQDQMEMYNAIVDTVQDKILPYVGNGFEFIIPSGTAIQNARTVFENVLTTAGDGYHLNDFGKFIAGAMWLRQIYGLSLDVFDSPYQAQGNVTVTLDDMAAIAQCAEDAFNDPFEVTEQ
ncbi:MAG: DUF4886 domain-containing protein [Treponema sp.]|nr:DUF4886 domain-containing protein [Treponema sp.]